MSPPFSVPDVPAELSGRHVRLVPLGPEHAEPLLLAATAARETYRFTGVPATAAQMRQYIDEALADRAAGRAVPFATVERASGAPVGSTRFGNVEFWEWPEGHPLARPPGAPDAVEIGWTWLTARCQRTGVNTEAKLLMLTHAFEVWRVRRVTLRTDARNERSRRNIERVGATLDGVLRAHMPAFDGGVRDTATYSLLAEEWPLAKERLAQRLR